jgi:hypothetical protein
MVANFTCFTCRPGLTTCTKVCWKKVPMPQGIKYIVRVGIAIFGSRNNPKGENPFDEDFHDNYVEGKGYSEAAALRDLTRNYNELLESLWV